jgi:hypothetical protein
MRKYRQANGKSVPKQMNKERRGDWLINSNENIHTKYGLHSKANELAKRIGSSIPMQMYMLKIDSIPKRMN